MYEHTRTRANHDAVGLLQAKAQLIQARFDHLEARTLAQADLHEGSVDKLQETNRQVGVRTLPRAFDKFIFHRASVDHRTQHRNSMYMGSFCTVPTLA